LQPLQVDCRATAAEMQPAVPNTRCTLVPQVLVLAVTGAVLPLQPSRLQGNEDSPALASTILAHGLEKSTTIVFVLG